MRAAFAIPALLSFAACGSGGGDDNPGDDEHYDCALEDRADTFVVGLEKISDAGTHFRIMQSVPAPPARGDNTLTFQITDGANAPIVDAELEVKPYMPDHGHGSPIQAVVTESTTVTGEYEVAPVNLWMPGLWQIIVDRTPAEQVIFAFCIPG
jgi:hypothetical protein